MVKVKKAAKLRTQAAAAKSLINTKAATGPLSRSQRKRALKHASLVKKKSLVTSTLLQRKAEVRVPSGKITHEKILSSSC
jgi:hypothetical protein